MVAVPLAGTETGKSIVEASRFVYSAHTSCSLPRRWLRRRFCAHTGKVHRRDKGKHRTIAAPGTAETALRPTKQIPPGSETRRVFHPVFPAGQFETEAETEPYNRNRWYAFGGLYPCSLKLCAAACWGVQVSPLLLRPSWHSRFCPAHSPHNNREGRRAPHRRCPLHWLRRQRTRRNSTPPNSTRRRFRTW